MHQETEILFDGNGESCDAGDSQSSNTGPSEKAEMQSTETAHQQSTVASTKRNDISQSRLYNGYSVRPEKGFKDLLLLRSFSSPALWPLDLNKTQQPVTASSTPGPVPSPDILFSKHVPSPYTQTNTQQIALHGGARTERQGTSRFGFYLQAKPFTPANPPKPSPVFHGSSTPTLATSSFPYDHSVTQSTSYDNYGYTTRWPMPETKDKQSNQWLNDSDTMVTGSTQNSNVPHTFIPSCISTPNLPDSSLQQDNAFQDPTTTALKTTVRIEDGVIPSAIVVKNIPFQIKKEQLLELFDTLDIPKPYAFNYHFDNGNFRGLAFANFYTPEETTRVILSLNGHDIMGRKLRVEYKRVLPVTDREKMNREKKEKRNQHEEQYSPSNAGFSKGKGKSKDIDLNDEATLKIYSRLLLFRDDQRPNAPNELVFPPDLHPQQRRIIHLIAEKLNLEHTSCGENDAKYIVINRSNPNNIDNVHKNFWNRPGFGISGRSVSPISSLSGTNLTSIGMTSTTNNFFDNSHTDSRLWSAKSFNDIRTINSQVPSKTYLHQVQPYNAVANTQFDSTISSIQNDLNVMMQDLNLDINNTQSKNTEWGAKKGLKNMTIKTCTN